MSLKMLEEWNFVGGHGKLFHKQTFDGVSPTVWSTLHGRG